MLKLMQSIHSSGWVQVRITNLIREGIETANKVLSLLEDMKSKFCTDTVKSASLLRTISDNEASTYNELAAYHSDDLEMSIYYNNLSLDIYESIGDTESRQTIQAIIDLKCDESKETAVESLRHLFNEAAQDETVYGCNSAEAIESVIGTASYLLLSNHAIEAERLLEKYIPISCRVHGNEHDKTKKIKKFLNRCKTRLVTLDYGHDESGVMQALRYEDDGDKCVIRGPVEIENVIYFALTEGATEYTVDSSSLLFAPGMPIICQGLQKAAHLNGKLADIRSYDTDKDRYTIYFEDTSLKPVAVKRKNVRIVFDLPEIE